MYPCADDGVAQQGDSAMDILVRGGRLIDPYSGVDQLLDLLVSDGLIAATGVDLATAGAHVFDARGKIVTPGLVDMHVHLRDPGLTAKEDIASGSRSAAAGGFTTIVAMPNTSPVTDSPEIIRYVKNHPDAVVSVLPSGAMTVGSLGRELSAFPALIEAGAVMLTDDGECVMDAAVMRLVMQEAACLGALVMIHAEDKNLSQGAVMHDGATSRELGFCGMPASAESVIVARDLLLAAETGCRLHVTHVSTRETVDLLRAAKKHGASVTSDVTPHSLSLNDTAVKQYGSNAKMYPPLRGEEDRVALIAALADGTIDAIATDHAPHTPAEKSVGMIAGPKGVIGLETAFGVGITYLVEPGHISLQSLIASMSSVPARLLSLDRSHNIRGLVPGARADLAVFDAGAEWMVNADAFKSKGRNSPFHGKKLMGLPVMTMSAGKIVMRDGEIAK
jgi:dihydroorotase